MRIVEGTNLVEFWDAPSGEHQRDHEAFKAYQRERENLYGYILNYPPDDLTIFHKIGCPHVWNFSNPEASLTEQRKVCVPAEGKAELLAYAGTFGEEWRLCDTCKSKDHDKLRGGRRK